MASNGGTLHGVPQSVSQQQQQQHICSQCGLYFESASSLQVHHMHYHQHDSMNRWGSQQQPVVSTTLGTTAVATTTTTATTITTNGTAPSSTTPTSSDTENNNQPGSHTPTHTTAGLKPVASPHTTIAAAADSSDNQPPTPQPTITEPGTPQSYGGGGTSPYHSQQQQQQQHQQQVSQHPHQLGLPTGSAGSEMHYPSYIHPGYDPGSYYSGGPGSGLDYGGGVLGAPLQPTDYKSGSSVVSSARYHPYGGGSSGSSNNGGGPDGSSPAVVSSNGGSAGMSPQVVSSSNGVTVAGSGSGSTTVTTVASTTSQSSQPAHSPPNGTGGSNIPPTPSPSPIQCEKCGMVCESDEALNEHEATIHSNVQSAQDQQQQQQRVDQVDLQGGGGNCYTYGAGGTGGTPVYPVKEEAPASDILDLDSQKMVGYGPAGDGGLLPPMNSLHPLQSMQRHPMMSWHDPHNFMGPPSLPPPHPSHGGGPDMKHSAAVAAAAAAAAYYHHPIKSEYSATPAIKSEYLGGGGGGHYGGTGSPIVKNEYSLPPTLPPPAVAPQPTNAQTMKQYADEMHDNQLATSPSDFPSTTTPQESGSQYRTFEPATSSLPGTAGPTKGTAWKSNEARRPKTYNCTACNKWFTSSGHLKRHYNTTLHKNAVKSSGQPDPATLPISVHHHPGRDPNYANKGRRGGAGNGSGAGAGGGGSGGAGSGGAGSQIQQPIQQPVPPPDPPRSPEYGTGPGAQQYGSASAAGFSTAGNSPGHQHPGSVGQVVSSNQSPGFHHPYAGATSANGTTASSTSSAVPPNGVAGPSVQVSQPRGLQIYSNSSNSHSMAEQMEQATHTITTILTPTTHPLTSTVGIPDTLGTRISTSTTRTPTDTHTPPTMGMGSPVDHLQQQPQPPQQQQPPPQHIISSMEPYHHPHTQPHTMHTISNPLTISTSIPSFQTILPEAPSYHLIIGNAAHHQHQQHQQQQQYHPSQMGLMAADGQWVDGGAGGDGLIESTTGDRNGSLGFPRCSGGAEVYQGDTAPPFSPNVPDQYQRPSSSDGTTILTNLTDQQQQHHHQQQQRNQQSQQMMIAHSTMGNKYKEYVVLQQQQQQQHEVDPYQEQLLYRVATPQLGATAPSISPAPCSPSVTSTDVGQTQLQSGQVESAKSANKANGQPDVHRCIECDKVFNKVCYLTQHNKTFHSGDKPYKCHRCGKRFPCNQSYEEHLAKHGGEKPFKCEQCPKQFNHKTDLRRHMCLHSGSKPYACEQCGKGFIRKDHMIKHSETHRKNVAAGQDRGGNGQKRAGKVGGLKKGGSKKDIVGLVDE